MRAVTSLADLRSLAATDPKYEKLAIVSANNLGGDVHDVRSAIHWLELNADETDCEEGVVEEVNFCLDSIR